MYLIDVIPAITIPRLDIQILSYFSSCTLPKGALVRITIGRRKTNAIVVSACSLEDEKIGIKKSQFQIKNIDTVITDTPILDKKQLMLLKYLSEYYITPLPLFVKTILPSYALQRKTKLHLHEIKNEKKIQKHTKKPLLILGEDRSQEYEKLIKKNIKAKLQVLLLVPNISQAHYYKNKFKHLSPTIVSSDITPKQIWNIWEKVRTSEIQFIIGTRMTLFLPFQSLGAIIIDEEQSKYYKSWEMAPYYHAKTVATYITTTHKAHIILGSSAPSIETYSNATAGNYTVLQTKNKSLLKKPDIFLVDMRNELLDKNTSPFSYLLSTAIEKALQNKTSKIILFMPRRGNESFSYCTDCGHITKCSRCDTHLVLHTFYRSNILMCHICGLIKEPDLLCINCKGHNIKTFGAGTQKIKEELKKKYKLNNIFILDSDIAKSPKKQQEIIHTFNIAPHAILIATQSILDKLDIQKADVLGVISLDHLLYIPDYTIGESIYQIMHSLLYHVKQDADFFVQTNMSENEMLKGIIMQNYEQFYNNEIKARKQLQYPPFSHMIKIIIKGKTQHDTKQKAQTIHTFVQKILSQTNEWFEILGPAPAYIPKAKNQYRYHIILKLDKKNMAKQHDTLRAIMHDVSIDVDPQSII